MDVGKYPGIWNKPERVWNLNFNLFTLWTSTGMRIEPNPHSTHSTENMAWLAMMVNVRVLVV